MIRSKANFKACAVALIATGMVSGSDASVIDRWDFNDTAGTTLNNATNSGAGGASFSNTALAVDGAGSLVHDSSTGNQFPIASGSFSATTGQYEIMYHLNAMTYDPSLGAGTISSGWNPRDSNAATNQEKNLAPILFAHNGNLPNIRIVSFNTEGFFQLFDYGAGVTSIDNVTIRAVFTLNGSATGTIDVYATDDDVDMGAGVGIEALLGTITTRAGATFDGISAFKQFYDAGATVNDPGESATFDYLQVSLVPEPSSMALVTVGAGLMAFRRRTDS